MVDGNTVICKNCNSTCSELDKFCPYCNFKLKITNSEPQIIQNTNMSIDEALTGLQMHTLVSESGKFSMIFRVYLFGSILGFCFFLLIFSHPKPPLELRMVIFPVFVLSFIICGPLVAILLNFQFKEQRYYYNSLTPIQIIQQIKFKNYKLVKQIENHYIFKKDKRDLTNLSLVLVLEKNFFILYGTNKVRNQLCRNYRWISFNKKFGNLLN